MKRQTLLSILLLGCTHSHAQVSDIFKKAFPPPGNKTEQLIFGGLKALKGMLPIGYKEEVALGGAVAVQAVARYGGLWRNAEVEKYLVTVGTAVALTSDRPEIPYYFGILNTHEPNAFACPGGYIFISKGLLKMIKDEAQLAGVLGHEIAHVSKKHALEAIRKSKLLSGVSEVTLTALDKDPKMFDSMVQDTLRLILDRGVGREKEMEADRIGTDFAFRVGYRPTALKDFLGVLGSIPASPGGLFQTHPSTADRVSNLAITLRKPEYQGASALPILVERFDRVLQGVSF